MKISNKIFLGIALVSANMIYAVPATFISPDQITVAPFSITAPGLYILADDVAYNTSGGTAITINSSDVTLDLNGKAIINSGPGVESGIALATTLTNITIKNGTLRVFDGNGISVPTGSTDLVFEDITIIGVSTTVGTAFNFAGIVGATTRTSNVMIRNCNASNCLRGISATATDAVMLRNSTFNRNGGRSLNVTDCNSWDFDHCQASFNSSSAEGIGLIATPASAWIIKNSDFSNNAGGTGQGSGIVFGVGGGHIIENCTFNNNSSVGPGAALALNMQTTNSCIIKNCICNGNFSTTSGAGQGMSITGTSIIIENCTANGNFVLAGVQTAAGLNIGLSSTGYLVRNCEFSGNTTFGTGGGIGCILVGGFGHVFENCSFTANVSFGGGIGRGLLLQAPATQCLIKGCTATKNSSNGFQHAAASGANLFIGNASFGHGTSGANNYVGAIAFLSVAATGPYPLAGSFDDRDLANLSFV